MNKSTAASFVSFAGMSPRPGYYSGYGVGNSLTEKHLEIIYNLVNKKIGKDAAENFIQMCENIILSPTNFLNQLYFLESNGWRFEKILKDSNIDFDKEERGEYSEGGLLGTIGMLLSSNQDIFLEKERSIELYLSFLSKVKDLSIFEKTKKKRQLSNVNHFGY